IRMRGVFDNAKGDLKPGLFARVRMPTGKPYQALLVPDEALQSDQGKKFLYVVNDKNEVEYRRVEVGQSVEGLRVIKAGRKEGGGWRKGEGWMAPGTRRGRPSRRAGVNTKAAPEPPQSPLAQVLRENTDDRGQKTDVGGQ